MTRPLRFVLTWLAAMLGLAVLVSGFNALIDPYDVFGSPRHAGINRFKPEAKNHSMLAKTYQIERFHPQTVLLGPSRVHIGINAHSPAWPAAMQPIYNYGIPGWSGTYTSFRCLEEAASTGSLQNAVVFIDFQAMFMPETSAVVPEEDQRRMLVREDGSPNPLRTGQRLKDTFLSLFTIGALADSASTILEQRAAVVLDLPPDGSSTEADFINAAHADGMYDLFAQKDATEVDRAHGLAEAMAGLKGDLPNMDLVARMIAFSRDHGIKLTMVLSPSHADALELYWRAGLWPRVEQFKTQLAATVAKEGRGAVPLWDFTEYSAWTTEPVPASGDRHTGTQWFWEPTHFKKTLGELMIRRIFDDDPTPFGLALTPENVAARNAAVRQQRMAVVCRSGRKMLTSMPNPPQDGCSDAE
jgi:hypothetical protein